MNKFDIKNFISSKVLKRNISLFEADMIENNEILRKQISNQSVLVIGGAGTIGSSFIKQLLPFKPKSLVVVDINENGLTELTRDLRSTQDMYIPEDYVTYPMSYVDEVFYKMFHNRKGFDIVANFSAHKHVRSEKDRYAVEVLINNNVINAKMFLDVLMDYPPKHFFCVSTDKAANPVSIMGGSKKIMEEMIMSYANEFPVTTARFANVIFSNGSLPFGFLERIKKNQPISAPSDVTRYFVSPEESGQICLLACIIGKTGEIYFPRLKEEQVMTFSTIAKNLLHYNGFDIYECSSESEALKKVQNIEKEYPVYFSKSTTSGEKPYEEFFTENETVDFTRHNKLGVIQNLEFKEKSEIEILIDKLKQKFAKPETTKKEIVLIMKDFLENFDHIETGTSLDSKM